VMARAPMTGEVYKANFSCFFIDGVAGIAQIYTGGKLFPHILQFFGYGSCPDVWHGF